MSAKAKTTKTTKSSTKPKVTETKEVRVRVIKRYFDLVANCDRYVGDEYVCDRARANHLAKNGFAEVL